MHGTSLSDHWLVRKYTDAVMQGEHGIGIGKKQALLMEVGIDTMGVMKSIKQALDPHWIMNPGKIMDVP